MGIRLDIHAIQSKRNGVGVPLGVVNGSSADADRNISAVILNVRQFILLLAQNDGDIVQHILSS